MKRFSWRAAAVLLVTFVLGGIAGGFAMRASHHKRFGRYFSGAPHEARERFLAEAMSRRLDLTDEQRVKVTAILEAHGEERRAIFEKCEPEHQALRAKIDGEIAAELNSEQRVKYEEMKKRRAERRRGRRGRP